MAVHVGCNQQSDPSRLHVIETKCFLKKVAIHLNKYR